MLLNPLLENLDQLKNINLTKEMVIGEPHFYAVRERWFSSDDRIPGAEKNGLYFYVSNNTDVWYIGKGQYTNGGGIGNRSCSHLGKPNRDQEEMIPFHEWAEDKLIEPTIRESLSRGHFKIVTLVVEPTVFISLLETFLQTVYSIASREELPPLNKRIG